jgi:ribosome-associated protein
MIMLLQLLPVTALLWQLSIRTITTTKSSVSAFVLYESQLQPVTLRSRRYVTMFAKLPVLSSSSSSSSESGNPQQQQQQPYAPPQPKQQQQRSNQQGKRDMINLMYGEQEQLPVVASTENENSHHQFHENLVFLDDTELDLIHTIARAADGRKAENIVALYVAHITTLTSVLIVVSGNSRPQNQAIGTAIRTAVTARSIPTSTNQVPPPPPSIEGTAESGWMILDYGSVMVHIMTPKSRLFYNIEGKWKQPTLLVANNRNENDQYPNDATGRTSTTTTAVTATAIPLDLSQMLIPNSLAPPPLSPLPGSTNAISPPLDPTDQLDEEEEEDETDPFWS